MLSKSELQGSSRLRKVSAKAKCRLSQMGHRKVGSPAPSPQPPVVFSKLPFERAVSTAADRKEGCRRAVSGRASETVLQIALGNRKLGLKVSFP